MDLTAFVNKFASQFSEEDMINITEDKIFRETDTWDSLTGMAILMMIEDEYNLTISPDQFIKLKTAREVYEFIQSTK